MDISTISPHSQCAACLKSVPDAELRAIGNLKVCSGCYPEARLNIESHSHAEIETSA